MATSRIVRKRSTPSAASPAPMPPAAAKGKGVRKAKTVRDIAVPDEMADVLSKIRANYGKGSVISATSLRQPWRIPTGIFTFDLATMGGIPHNRISMFHGPKHSGKSTAALRCVAGAQVSMPNQTPVFVDVEGTLDPVWAAKIGIDMDRLIVVQPDTGEQAVDMVVALIHARETSLVVVDSLAALLPIKESEASAEDSLVGQQSRLITSMLRKVSAAQITERKRGHFVSVLFINQQRSKIGGFTPPGMEPMSLPGGKALGFFTSLEVRWKNKEVSKASGGYDELAHNEHAFTIEKNKMNGGMRQGEFRMLRRADDSLGLPEAAIDDAETMLAFAKRWDFMTGGGRGGQTLAFGDFSEKFANTAEAVTYLYQNLDVKDALRCSLIASYAEQHGMPEYFTDYLLTGERAKEEEAEEETA